MTRVMMFDLGGVLIENDMFAELKKLTGADVSEAALKSRWLKSPAAREFELGMCSPEHFANSIIEEFEMAVAADEFLDAFAGWPKGFYSGAESLLRNLRTQYATGCLSNSNEVHWTTKLVDHFDHSYSSHLLTRIKPDAEVFEFVTADIGCSPDEITFFDDSQPNIDAAQSFGWDAHLTVGFTDLNRVLGNLGILT